MTDTSAEGVANKLDPLAGEYLVRLDDYRALLAERDTYKARAETAERLAEASSALLNRDERTSGNAEQTYYDNVYDALANYRGIGALTPTDALAAYRKAKEETDNDTTLIDRALIREREAAERLAETIEADMENLPFSYETIRALAAYRKAQKETDDG